MKRDITSPVKRSDRRPADARSRCRAPSSHLALWRARRWALSALARSWAYDGAAREARIVITVSQFSRDRMAKDLDIDAARIRVVHHGIDHARFPPDDDSGTIACRRALAYLGAS